MKPFQLVFKGFLSFFLRFEIIKRLRESVYYLRKHSALWLH